LKTSILSAVFLLAVLSNTTVGQSLKTANVVDVASKTERPLITSLTLESLQHIVQAMGFECTREKGETGKEYNWFGFRAEGYKVVAFALSDPNFLQLYNGFTDVHPTLATVNEWNQKNTLSRAYVAKDGTASLESDLFLGGGVTTETVELFITTFRDSVARWARFIMDRQNEK
jgi:hypothetical protein